MEICGTDPIRLGLLAHKCMLLNNMTPNMTIWTTRKTPELN